MHIDGPLLEWTCRTVSPISNGLSSDCLYDGSIFISLPRFSLKSVLLVPTSLRRSQLQISLMNGEANFNIALGASYHVSAEATSRHYVVTSESQVFDQHEIPCVMKCLLGTCKFEYLHSQSTYYMLHEISKDNLYYISYSKALFKQRLQSVRFNPPSR